MPGIVIRTFLVDGKPDGLRTIELSNSTVLGTIFPRPSLDVFLKRQPSQRPGVYLLIGQNSDESDKELVYVGEGDPVGPRLKSHGVQKEFWTQAAVFTSKDDYLTKTQIQYLEAAFIEAIKSISRAKLDNVNTPTSPNISEADQAEVSGFFETVKLLLGTLNFNFLQTWEEPAPKVSSQDIFFFHANAARAQMIRSASSYVILAGSTAQATNTPSVDKWIAKLRQQLLDAGNLLATENPRLLKFAKDTAFSSPSAAAGVVYGGNKNGLISWKLPDGRKLKEVENEAATGE